MELQHFPNLITIQSSDSCSQPQNELLQQVIQEQMGKKSKKHPKSSKKANKRAKKSSQSSPYHWSCSEHRKYLEFLKTSGHLLTLSQKDRIKAKVNIVMSRQIKSKNAVQCHTHHQKMVQKFRSIESIIEQSKKLFVNDIIKKSDIVQQKKDNAELVLNQNLKRAIIVDDSMPEPCQYDQIHRVIPLAVFYDDDSLYRNHEQSGWVPLFH